MKSPKYPLYLTSKEYTQVISEGRYTDAVDKLLIKFSKARTKNLKVVYTN